MRGGAEVAMARRDMRPAERAPAALVRRLAVAAVMLGALALALWYGSVVPLAEGPDEPGHFDYILHLVRERRLPGEGPPLDQPGEAHQPPLAYLLALPAASWLPEGSRRIELAENPGSVWRGGADPAAYFRRSAELLPPRGLLLAWRLARGVSAMLGALTVGLTYLLARRLGCSFGVALGAAALLASLPQYAFHHGLVSNDPLLWTLCTATLVWLTPGSKFKVQSSKLGADTQPGTLNLEPETSGSWAVILGLLLGAALLTKLSALLLLPLAAAGLWLRWRAGLLARPWLSALLAALAALAVSGWWFARNMRLTGDPLGLAAFREHFATAPFDPSSAEQWRQGLWMLGSSLAARFGWASLPAGALAFRIAGAVVLVGLLGLVLGAWRGARPSRWGWLAALLVLLSAGWLGLFVRTAGHVGWQGRFLFPALPPLAVGLAWGLAQLRPRPAWLAAGVVALLGLALSMPTATIRPAYRWLTSAPVAGAPLYGVYADAGEPGVELRGAAFPAQARPGTALPVELTWRALGRPGRSWTIFIHLAPPGQKREAAASDRQPLGGAFPMLAWTSEDWLVDVHPVEIPADMAPGAYVVRVGFFDPVADGDRAGAYRDGRLIGDYIEVGTVEVLR